MRGGRGHRVVVEGEDEQRAAAVYRVERERADVVLDPEVLALAVDVRGFRVRVDRLEADAELADLGEVLVAAGHAADGTDVGRGERATVVTDLKAVLEQGKG